MRESKCHLIIVVPDVQYLHGDCHWLVDDDILFSQFALSEGIQNIKLKDDVINSVKAILRGIPADA